MQSRQRNSDSTSSKEGQSLRGKGRGGGANAGSNSVQATPTVKNPVNTFNKPSVAVLKKTGESFLQVNRSCFHVPILCLLL